MKQISYFKNLSIQARCLIVLFGIAAALSAAWALFSGEVPHAGRLALLVILGAASAHTKVRLTKTSSLSLLTSVVMLSLMVDGKIAAVAVGVAGVTVQAFLPSRKFIVHRFVFNAAMVVLAIHAASVPYNWLVSQHLAVEVMSHLIGIIAASLTYYLGNSISISLIVGLTECKSVFRIWYDHFLLAAPSFLSSGLLSVVFAEILAKTIIGAAILLPLMYVSYRTFRMASALAANPVK
jgi:hypothetical protein